MEVTSQTIGTGDSARQAEPKIVFFVFFIDFRVFKTRKQMSNINFADDWIRTADLWYQKQSLYQLSHNHCPCFLC